MLAFTPHPGDGAAHSLGFRGNCLSGTAVASYRGSHYG
jgi:hypothetical protein